MKTNYKRISLSFLICISLFLAQFPVYAANEIAGLSDAEQNRNESMTSVFNFWDSFTDEETGEYLPPEFFGGLIINDDGSLTACMTTYSKSDISTLYEACGAQNLSIVQVKNSYVSLVSIQNFIEARYGDYIITSTICIPDNAVNIYVEPSGVCYGRFGVRYTWFYSNGQFWT